MQVHAQFMHLRPRVLRYSASLLKQLSYILLGFHIALYSVCRYTGLHMLSNGCGVFITHPHNHRLEIWILECELHRKCLLLTLSSFVGGSYGSTSYMVFSSYEIQRYLTLFHQTGDVKPASWRNGAQRLLGDLEQLRLLQIILRNPGIYLHEVQLLLEEAYGIKIHVSTICRTLKFMGCTRQIMLYSDQK